MNNKPENMHDELVKQKERNKILVSSLKYSMKEQQKMFDYFNANCPNVMEEYLNE